MGRCEQPGCAAPPLPYGARCATHDPAVALIEHRWVQLHGTYAERYPPLPRPASRAGDA